MTVGCVDEIARDASRDVTAWHSIQLEGVSAVAVVTLNLLGVGHRLTILDPREYECRRHLMTDRYFTSGFASYKKVPVMLTHFSATWEIISEQGYGNI